MVRIPDKSELGQPIVSPARPNVTISRDALTAPGRAMAGFGQIVKEAGASIQADLDQQDDYETKRRFVQFDLDQEKALDDAKRNVQPEAKGFTPGYMSSYDANAKNFFETVPENLKPKYDYLLTQRGANYEKRAYDYELAERDKYHLNDVDTQTQALRYRTTEKPESYRENLARGVSLIDASRLPPDTKTKLRKSFAQGVEEDAIRARIGGGEDPEKVIEDIKRAPRTAAPTDASELPEIKRVSGPRSQGPRRSAIEGVVIHHTSGSSLDGALETGRGNGTGATYYVDRDGSIKQAADESERMINIREPGSKYRNGKWGNLTNDSMIGIEVVAKNDKDVTPEQRKTLKALLGDIVKRNNLDPANVVGHGEIQGGPGGNKEADEGRAAAEDFRTTYGREGTTQYAQAGGSGVPDFQAPAGLIESGNIDLKSRPRVINDDGTTSTIRSISINDDGKEVIIPTIADDGTQLSDAAATALYKKTGRHLGKFDNPDNATAFAKRLHEDQEALIDAEEGEAPYRHLTPEKRRTLIEIARTAGRATVIDDIENDVAQIRRAGTPKMGADGRTSLERAKTLLTPRQLQVAKEKWSEAELEYKTITPLANMSEDEAHEHIGAMLPDDGDADYATRVKVARTAEARLKQIVTERKKDPALSVNATPEVREAFDVIKRAGQAQNGVNGGTVDARPLISPVRAHEMVIEARIAAQRRLGLSDSEISPITNRQIQDLLQIPDPRLLSANDLTKKLKEASARAEELYGPKYAKMAFESATRTIAKSQQMRDLVSPIVRKMIVGESVTPEDYKAAEALSRASVSDVLFDPTANTGAGAMMYGADAPQAFPKTKTEPGSRGIFSSSPDKTTGPFTSAKPVGSFPKPPPEAVQMLQDNPGLFTQFDNKYGPGSAAAALKR